MDVNSLETLKQFNLYTYGNKALTHWTTGRYLREQGLLRFLESVILEYEMACEQFLKHIISRSEGLRKDHIHSHNVWALACDAEIMGREKYRALLKKLGAYYIECRYESDDVDTAQAIFDYFNDDSRFEEMDALLFDLYTSAQDTDRTFTKQGGKPASSRKLDLFKED